jgi:hypothetical protein
MCGCGESIEGKSLLVGVEGDVIYECAEKIRNGTPSKNFISRDGFRLEWRSPSEYQNRKMDEVQRADYERCLAWGQSPRAEGQGMTTATNNDGGSNNDKI